MGKKVSSEMSLNNISTLVEFSRDNTNKSVKTVIAKRGNEILFNDKVSVIVGDYNIYYRLDIIWDDVVSEDEYHNLGLYGYYSSDYCEISYSQEVLTIDTTDGIVITIV